MDIKLRIKNGFKNTWTYIYAFIKWAALGLLVGLICGGVGALFVKALTAVTSLRTDNGWLILLLPIGGLVSVAIYKLCKTTDIGTNHVFESVREEKDVPLSLAPAIFSGAVITHLLGGSAGREGAALQLGGSIAAGLGKLFRFDYHGRHILTLCGMGAFFSAIFGTPIGACIFALEVVSVGKFYSFAFFPGIISSVTAFEISTRLGVHPERFHLPTIPNFTIGTLWKVVVIAVLGAMLSTAFCKVMHFSEHWFKKLLKNEYLRITIGAVPIVALTYLLKTTDYNGGGIDVINRIFETGDVKYEAFALKILFTAITIGCGFKGGEIVPTFFIGATLGATLATLLGLPLGFGAALGMVALFCGVTNCPLATIVISIELFGGNGLLFFAMTAVISFLLSGYTSLYTGQKLFFSKLSDEVLDRNAD